MTTVSTKSTRRSYDQGCGIAVGLDLVGERWTLLVIRELLLGPARFNDLLESLHGISPNLLTDRLRFLESAGLIIRKSVDSDGRGKIYELTERGQALRPMILELAKWGLANAGDYNHGNTRPQWAALAMEAMSIGRSLPSDVTENYRFVIEDFTFYIVVYEGHGSLSVEAPAEAPAVTVHASASTMLKIGTRELNPLIALASDAISVEGSVVAFENCGRLLGLLD